MKAPSPVRAPVPQLVRAARASSGATTGTTTGGSTTGVTSGTSTASGTTTTAGTTATGTGTGGSGGSGGLRPVLAARRGPAEPVGRAALEEPAVPEGPAAPEARVARGPTVEPLVAVPVSLKCPTGATTPTLTGLTPTKVNGVPPNDSYSQGFGNVEGLVWIGDSLYMSHISGEANPPKSRILKLTGSNVSVFADGVGTNGLAVDATGNLVGATPRQLFDTHVYSLANPTSAMSIAGMYMGKRFDSPNDLTIRYRRYDLLHRSELPSAEPFPQDKTRVYRITPAGVVSVVDENLSQPNGVTFRSMKRRST